MAFLQFDMAKEWNQNTHYNLTRKEPKLADHYFPETILKAYQEFSMFDRSEWDIPDNEGASLYVYMQEMEIPWDNK